MGLVRDRQAAERNHPFAYKVAVVSRISLARTAAYQESPEVAIMKTSARNTRHTPRVRPHRRGTTMVEFALVLPVFFTFVFGIVEYGHLQLVSNMLTTACRSGARFGSTDNVTTADARVRVEQILSAALDTNYLTVIVKDASVFDTPGPYPSAAAEYQALTDFELDEAEPRQLFLIRASVAYNDVALFPFAILDGVQLTGQALMRHE